MTYLQSSPNYGMPTRAYGSVRADGIAKSLGARQMGGGWTARCPAHEDRNPSLSIRSGEGGKVLVHCHAGCDQQSVIDALRARGLWDRHAIDHERRAPRQTVAIADQTGIEMARFLWGLRQAITGSAAETYLRAVRHYRRPFPATLGFLPARGKHPPAMIAAFAMAGESEPGILSVLPTAVRAVHITKLKPDGTDKADVEQPKIILGRGATGVPIVLAAPNDGLGLAITEGIEDGLSIHEATGLGVWAAGGAPRMAALADALPDCIESVTIIGDEDEAGIRAANALAQRLAGKGVSACVKFLKSTKVQ
jgi:hypothetical protein